MPRFALRAVKKQGNIRAKYEQILTEGDLIRNATFIQIFFTHYTQ